MSDEVQLFLLVFVVPIGAMVLFAIYKDWRKRG